MSIYQDIGLNRVVNASGRVTVLGVSTISDRVAKAAVAGGQSYVVIEDLMCCRLSQCLWQCLTALPFQWPFPYPMPPFFRFGYPGG